jgi:hypothetical protein
MDKIDHEKKGRVGTFRMCHYQATNTQFVSVETKQWKIVITLKTKQYGIVVT